MLLLASTGCGLLVSWTAGRELSHVLVVPVGFALVVVICAFATSYGWLAPAAGPIVAVAAAAGYALEARGRLARPWRVRFDSAWVWPALAGLAVFAAVGGPVFLTGRVGWAGFTRIVDLAFQLDFSQYLADAGRVSPPNGNASYTIVTAKLLSIGYPGGSQATLGAMAKLVHVNVAWAYQAFLAFTAAIGGMAIYSTLRHVTQNRLFRCIGGIVAMQPNVLYGYTNEAGIKELTTTALLMVVVATLADWLAEGRGAGERDSAGPVMINLARGGAPRSPAVHKSAPLERVRAIGSPRGMIPPAVAVSGAFAAFSLGIAPWLGVLLLGSFVASLLRPARRMRAIAGWVVFTVVAVVISIPGIITAGKLATVAGSAVGGVVDLGLGNLAAPVSKWAAAGVWFTGDYRYPVTNATASEVFDIVILALAGLGFLVALVRRRWTFVVIGLTAGIALWYFIEHSTAWIQFKAFTVTAAFSVLLAFAGAAVLQSNRRRWVSALGWIGALTVAGAVMYGNALIYHDTPLAPGTRYHDLAAIAKRYAGHGPTLDPYFDEYAEYFLRDVGGSTIVDPANLNFQVRPGVPLPPNGISYGWDLNQLVPAFVQHFPLIIQPRSPTASRAPANYDLAERTRYFEVWRRDRPSNTVFRHFPLSGLPNERTPAYCKVFLHAVKRAGAGAQVAYAKPSAVAIANPVNGVRPDYWRPLGPSTISLLGAGSARMRFLLPEAGHFSIWLQGSIGRPLTFYVDGRRVGSIGYEERYPSEFLFVASTTLRAGAHTLRVVRGNGTLHPGSGDPSQETIGRTLGAVVFYREDNAYNDRVYVAPAASAARVCAAPVGYQWLEVLKPGGAPPDALPAS